MLIKGQGCICDLSSTSLRERHGSEGSWIDGNGRPLVHYREQGRAEEVLQELWEQAKTGAGFYEIPSA